MSRFIIIIFSFGIIFSQSPCCKNKAAGVSCTKTTEVQSSENVLEESLPASCKSNAKKGIS